VDDVDSNLFVAKGFLRSYKLVIETAESGIIAVEKIKAGEVYDIIFMDHMMPEMDGIEATQIIRDMGYDNPIVALTANAFSDMEEMFTSKGFSGYASKPIDFMQIDKFLREFIRDKQPQEVIDKARKAKATSTAGRDRGIYEILSASFLRDAKNAAELFESMDFTCDVDAAKLDNYIIQIHTVKHALKNIGRKPLANTAQILEKAGRDRKFKKIHKELPAFLQKLHKVIAELDPGDESTNISEDMDFLRKNMEKIVDACAFSDRDDALSAVKELQKMPYSKKINSVIEGVAALLVNNDLDEAGELAEHALRL
jgi:CheY-like chemotaxis protein